MIDCANVLGVVLAGGRSTRMGTDKALLTFGGLPLVSHAVRLLHVVFQEVIVVSDSADKYSSLGLNVVPDVHKGIGPLGGIQAALQYTNAEAVFVSSCDMPCVPSDLIRHMLGIESPLLTRIPKFDGFLQPLFAIYDTSLLSRIETEISAGRYSILDFVKTIDFLTLDVTPRLPFYSPDMFSNVNSPSDYARLRQAFGRSLVPE